MSHAGSYGGQTRVGPSGQHGRADPNGQHGRAAGAPYPTKPVTLVVGSAAEGSNDVFARAIGKRLQDALGQPVVDRLNAEITRQIQSDEMKAFFLKEGAEPAPMKPPEFAAFVASEIERWKRVAKAADIKPD